MIALLFTSGAYSTCVGLSDTQKGKHFPFYAFPAVKQEEKAGLHEVLKNDPKAQHCSSETCNRRGDCVVEGSEVKCACMLGYSGLNCEEEEARSTAGSVVLAIIAILLIAMTAAGMYLYFRRQRSRERYVLLFPTPKSKCVFSGEGLPILTLPRKVPQSLGKHGCQQGLLTCEPASV